MTPRLDTSAGDDLERFRNWCQERVESDAVKHSYSSWAAKRRYAKAHDVDRYFIHQYQTFSTVLITYERPRSIEEGIVEHTEQFYSHSVTSKRRRVLKQLGVFDEYAGISVLAPKDWEPSRVPGATTSKADQVKSHAHDFLWMPGSVSESDFDFSRVAADDVDIDVSVRIHPSDQVKTPDRVAERGTDYDTERGDTTALPKELGNNLPVLGMDLDARGLSSYAERWCAKIRLGADDSIETGGLDRIRKLGEFDSIAKAWKWRRRIKNRASSAKRLAGTIRLEGYGTQ